MPDLGKYALEVGLAYGASAVLIGGLIVWSLVRAKRTRDRLRAVEDRLRESET